MNAFSLDESPFFYLMIEQIAMPKRNSNASEQFPMESEKERERERERERNGHKFSIALRKKKKIWFFWMGILGTISRFILLVYHIRRLPGRRLSVFGSTTSNVKKKKNNE